MKLLDLIKNIEFLEKNVENIYKLRKLEVIDKTEFNLRNFFYGSSAFVSVFIYTENTIFLCISLFLAIASGFLLKIQKMKNNKFLKKNEKLYTNLKENYKIDKKSELNYENFIKGLKKEEKLILENFKLKNNFKKSLYYNLYFLLKNSDKNTVEKNTKKISKLSEKYFSKNQQTIVSKMISDYSIESDEIEIKDKNKEFKVLNI